MSRRFKFSDADSLYFISYAVVFWIDVFTRNEYREMLVIVGSIASKIKGWKYIAG